MHPIEKACKISDSIFSTLFRELKQNHKTKKFSTEKDVHSWIVQEIKKTSYNPSFDPLVVAQGNEEEIHHKANTTKLKPGFLILDLGVRVNGYCSDCTRTVYLGIPSKKDIDLYNAVLTAYATAKKEATPGMCAADVDLIARTLLLDHFQYFVHATGHGIGRKVHQKPVIAPRSAEKLKEGMFITIEPGIYIKNKAGIRIEDTIRVQNNPISLTKTTTQLLTFKI